MMRIAESPSASEKAAAAPVRMEARRGGHGWPHPLPPASEEPLDQLHAYFAVFEHGSPGCWHSAFARCPRRAGLPTEAPQRPRLVFQADLAPHCSNFH